MVYLRCGVKQCDLYYSEILLGQLYVGSLYTLNQGEEESDFCPTKIVGSPLQNLLYFRCQCEGSDTVNIFYSVMSYRKGDLYKIETLPSELENAKDLEMIIYSQQIQKLPDPGPPTQSEAGIGFEDNFRLTAEVPVEFIIVFSLENQSLWLKVNSFEVEGFTKVDIGSIIHSDSIVT